MFNKDYVKKLCDLAYIQIDETQAEKLSEELESINNAVQVVDEVKDKTDIKTVNPLKLTNVFRPDKLSIFLEENASGDCQQMQKNDFAKSCFANLPLATNASDFKQEVIKSAPNSLDGQFVVPKILGDD